VPGCLSERGACRHWGPRRYPIARSAPEILEAVRRQLGIAHGVLDIPVTEIGLQRPGIVPLVGQSEAAGVSEHMWMGLELEASRRARTSSVRAQAARVTAG